MAQTAERTQETSGGGSPLVTVRGKTTAKDAMVISIVSEAVKEISVVEPEISGRGASLPGDNSPTVSEFLSRMTGGSSAHGIFVEVGEKEAAVDVPVTVPYGRFIPDVTSPCST